MKAEARVTTRTFRGKTMAEALDQVKRHFGRHAVILHTRAVDRGGFFGVRSKPYVEITAARCMADLPEPLRSAAARRRRLPDEAAVERGSSSPNSETSTGISSDLLLRELGSLKTLVRDLVQETRKTQSADVPPALCDTYTTLIQNEVAEQIARQLVDRIKEDLGSEAIGDAAAVRARLAAAMESMLPTAGPVRLAQTGGPTIVALVGPTGVGKTTTIAKLAANFRLREHRKVGLVTIDTYRIAAVEQLRTYAEIIQIPLEVVMSPEQFRDAVGRLSDRDVILVDTAGRSQRDAMKIKELQRFFTAVRPHEMHLVLSGTANEAVLAQTMERFQELGIDRVIFTKLDEAIGFGVILNCLSKINARMSYVTNGQDVPEDIAVAHPKSLIPMILGQSRNEEVVAETGVHGGPAHGGIRPS